MTKLSVNVNKIATLRNARGENNPNVLSMALLIESLGVHGITVHPRPDERHIKKRDVFEPKKNLAVELNIEGYSSPDFINLVCEVRPAQVTLVPDPPDVLTSNAGFLLKIDFAPVCDAVTRLKPSGARVSLFIDPKDFIDRSVEIIAQTGAQRIERYTKAFADNPHCPTTLALYCDVARRVKELGLGISAGHDLSLDNLGILLDAIPFIDEVSIGHALICDALLMGIPETLKRYLAIADKRDG
jgi:pyridoxine 5-phosphate synthase